MDKVRENNHYPCERDISAAQARGVGQNSLVQMSLFDRPAIPARPRSMAAVRCHPVLRQDACLPASLRARYRGPERPPSFHHDLLAGPGIRTLEFEACGYDFVCSHSCMIGSTSSRLAIHRLETRNRHVVGKRRTEFCPTPPSEPSQAYGSTSPSFNSVCKLANGQNWRTNGAGHSRTLGSSPDSPGSGGPRRLCS
jgi:hypothetical protein